jgi:hypothetical protein
VCRKPRLVSSDASRTPQSTEGLHHVTGRGAPAVPLDKARWRRTGRQSLRHIELRPFGRAASPDFYAPKQIRRDRHPVHASQGNGNIAEFLPSESLGSAVSVDVDIDSITIVETDLFAASAPAHVAIWGDCSP